MVSVVSSSFRGLPQSPVVFGGLVGLRSFRWSPWSLVVSSGLRGLPQSSVIFGGLRWSPMVSGGSVVSGGLRWSPVVFNGLRSLQ